MVGLTLPIASPAPYGLNVLALLWTLVTLLGTVSVVFGMTSRRCVQRSFFNCKL